MSHNIDFFSFKKLPNFQFIRVIKNTFLSIITSQKMKINVFTVLTHCIKHSEMKNSVHFRVRGSFA